MKLSLARVGGGQGYAHIRCALSLMLCFCVSAFRGSEASAQQPWHTIVADPQSTPVQLALVDLERYIGQCSGKRPRAITPSEWQAAPVPAVIIGAPDNNSLIQTRTELLAGIESHGYAINTTDLNGVPVVLLAARTSQGTVNAVYGLLHELGFGFYLGSEAIPLQLPDRLSSSSIFCNPALSIRGVLPWYNFFNSPTTWDPIDHRAFADQLIRMRANFIGFHTYDSEPFAAYEENGSMHAGRRLATTSETVWGTHPMPTKDFSSGTSGLYAHEHFGAETTREPDANQAIRFEQQVMRNALAYARDRGLHTCIGFEVGGDPMQPAERARFAKRFNSLLDLYPSIDHVWLWQPEGRGSSGTHPPAQQNEAGDWESTNPLAQRGIASLQLYARAADVRANPRYIAPGEPGKLARATEGARLELYAKAALEILNGRANPPRLIISGWGGEDRMVSAEYYEGLDKVLPKSVVFASLEFIIPRARIDDIYSTLPADRERWPIPWLEYDGDQWHPQPFVHTYEKMMSNVFASGSQGILGIHWRTREVEENLAFMVEAAWNPQLTAGEFFRGYAQRTFPGDISTTMSRILSELDQLGYRWVGGKGQAEYRHFTWGPGNDPRKVDRLRRLLAEIKSIKSTSAAVQMRLEWLANRIEYVLAFQALSEAAVRARELLDVAKSAEGDNADRRELAADALRILNPDLLHRTLQTYALRVSTRGEHGVLATINTKAVPAWRELMREAALLSGEKYTTPTTTWRPQPAILLPRFHGSCPAGHAFELYPIVLGDQPAWTHYRGIGEKEWATEPLSLFQRQVYYAQIPPRSVQPPGMEIGFSFSQDPNDNFAFGPIGITAMPGNVQR